MSFWSLFTVLQPTLFFPFLTFPLVSFFSFLACHRLLAISTAHVIAWRITQRSGNNPDLNPDEVYSAEDHQATAHSLADAAGEIRYTTNPVGKGIKMRPEMDNEPGANFNRRS
jgi:hypothetical protein